MRNVKRLGAAIVATAMVAYTGTGFGQATALSGEAGAKAHFSFAMGTGSADPAKIAVAADTVFSKERGYGFEPGAAVTAKGAIRSDKPFQFSVKVPEGSYQVTVTLGDREGESKTTVKAELRRLFVERAILGKGEVKTYTFNVNVRTPAIPGGGEVRLKPRETQGEARAWDEKLTLEFDDEKPCVTAIEIQRVDNLPVVYVCGDSTVCDQPGENNASWGQMLTRFFNKDVVIANHGESGESLKGFLGEKRWDKVMSLLKPGDFVIIQMGHNDEKEKGEGVGALTTYKADLKRFVADARKKGATAIIVSPMERRGFDEAGKVKPSHGDYPRAVREAAAEDKVAFIDLTAMSVKFYEALGADKAYLAFAGTGTNRDATHHDNYGAYELAKCIVQGIRDNKVELAKYVVEDFKGFDPAKPDPEATFVMPRGPSTFTATPYGN